MKRQNMRLIPTVSLDRQGYLQVLSRTKKKYWSVHRIVMEMAIGRELLSSESVHHIDHDINNNKISNLMLISPESAHRLLHRLGTIHSKYILFKGANYKGEISLTEAIYNGAR